MDIGHLLGDRHEVRTRASTGGHQREPMSVLAHRDLASRIHIRSAPEADKPEPT